jgi:hypothetical protein
MSSENWKYVCSRKKAFDGGYPYGFLTTEEEIAFVDSANCPHKRFLIQYEGFGCGNQDYTDYVLRILE